ncbi:MAG: Integral membrane protein TerC [uncultured Rubrobacteraceae bacterium]|uniref:Integral membrane protein TerC n=1 Tax=uncultured Rubrobacteraceae bacterium TaxID=349277 RepID=A0A6J4QYQ7_9ACTN|nr:MAG: Integral membrane protein TerC [uncultured Rubrobacteraceae bacterium]
MVFPVWAWVGFGAFILLMLVLDLFVLHRNAKEISFREAAILSAFWVAVALLFGIVVWIWAGPTVAGEYYAGYVIEKALSVDNVFVFALIFAYFAVPMQYQYRVLVWGVIGALVLRVIFILIGAELLETYDWMVYLFGAFLIYTGIRMARHSNQEVHPERNPVLRLLRRILPMTDGYRGQKLLVREGPGRGRLMATPLLAVLIAVETTDVVFAVDSIPAIFAITTNTFVVWTSNAFAILGLRALYFMLAGLMQRFVYLSLGLSLVLVFVGAKFIWSDLFGKVPIWVSLPFIATVVAVSIAASLWKTRAKVS